MTRQVHRNDRNLPGETKVISGSLKVLASASLLMAGSAAVAQSAQPLSLAGSPAAARAGAELGGAAEMRGRGLVPTYALGLALIAILVFVLVEATDNNDETEPPDSP